MPVFAQAFFCISRQNNNLHILDTCLKPGNFTNDWHNTGPLKALHLLELWSTMTIMQRRGRIAYVDGYCAVRGAIQY